MTTVTTKATNLSSDVDDANRYLLLAGDIGGTNTRLALYDREQGDVDSSRGDGSRYNRPLFQQEYLNEDYMREDSEEFVPFRAQNHSTKHDTEDDNTIDRNEENLKLFAQRILGPFLELALETSKANDNVVIVCCLAVAGPVDPSRNNGTVTTSQRDYWKGLNGTGIVRVCQTIGMATNANGDSEKMALSFVKECVVINDFVAQGYGCLSLSTDSGELWQLHGNSKTSSSHGPRFCVGAGTGFGSCYMVPTTTTRATTNSTTNNHPDYACFPSEYGQSDWAPISVGTTQQSSCSIDESKIIKTNSELSNNDDQTKLWEYLQDRKARENGGLATDTNLHISVEDVVSGIGLATAYECLAHVFPAKTTPSVREKFESARDLRGKVVGEHASDCEICKRAVEIVLRAYGSVVGSCAMAFLPTGGLYITGGLLRNLLGTTPDRSTDATSTGNENCSEMSTLSHNSSSVLTLFMNAYRSKGPASFLLNDIPLYMVQAKDTGLRGAAVRAEMELKTHIAQTLEYR